MPAVFTVQTDEGDVVDANAYISVAYYRQYHLDRGRDLSAQLDAAIQVGIVRATDYIDTRWRLQFAGTLLEHADDFEQSTAWPRDGVYKASGLLYVGLPEPLKRATAEYAKRAVTAELLVDGLVSIVDGEPVPTGQVTSTSVTVGPITDSKTYAENYGVPGSGTVTTDGCLLPKIPAADLLIEPLLKAQSRQRRVIRS